MLSLRYCFSYSGIKTFDNRGTAIREMTRVAKAGVKIVMVDEMIKLMEALTWFLDIRQLLGTYLDLEP